MVMQLSRTLLIEVLPPVEMLTLLRPYPPKAGKAMKHPPMTFANPNATSSRLALSETPCTPSLPAPSPPPSALAATEDSKKPSMATRKAVLSEPSMKAM